MISGERTLRSEIQIETFLNEGGHCLRHLSTDRRLISLYFLTACGGNIYIHNADSTGYVTSPNHPDHYPQHADCIWLIAAPPGKLIRLQFEGQFSIEVTPK